MPSVRDIENAVFDFAPRRLAQSWDNVGLLVGRADAEVRKILVSLDITEAVAGEAERLGADLIVSHHPLIFHPAKSVTDRDPVGRILLRLTGSGIAAVCMHTNLDAAEHGVNEALANALGLQDAKPAVEQGVERTGTLSAPVELPEFLALVGERLQPNGIRYVSGGRAIQKVAVGGGACADFLEEAVALGCDALVTADAKYNHFLDAKALGLTLVDAGHFPTEDVVCPVLADLLREKFPGLTVEKSQVHREVCSYWTPGGEEKR